MIIVIKKINKKKKRERERTVQYLCNHVVVYVVENTRTLTISSITPGLLDAFD